MKLPLLAMTLASVLLVAPMALAGPTDSFVAGGRSAAVVKRDSWGSATKAHSESVKAPTGRLSGVTKAPVGLKTSTAGDAVTRTRWIGGSKFGIERQTVTTPTGTTKVTRVNLPWRQSHTESTHAAIGQAGGAVAGSTVGRTKTVERRTIGGNVKTTVVSTGRASNVTADGTHFESTSALRDTAKFTGTGVLKSRRTVATNGEIASKVGAADVTAHTVTVTATTKSGGPAQFAQTGTTLSGGQVGRFEPAGNFGKQQRIFEKAARAK